MGLAKQVLGRTPRTAPREGLKRTIAYFEALLRDERVRGAIAADS